MDFDLREDQQLLRDSVGAYLARHYSFDQRRAVLQNGAWRPDIWSGFAEQLGLLGATIPETLGGFGGGPVETMIICEKLGEALVLEPYIEWVTLASALLNRAGDSVADLVAGIVDGSLRIAPALYEDKGRFSLALVTTRCTTEDGGWTVTGTKTGIAGTAGATHFLVSARASGEGRDPKGIALLLVAADAPDIERRDYTLIDGRSASDVSFHDTPARLIEFNDDTLATIERAVDEATVAVCAEAVGVMQTALDMTVAYASQRQQFGKPIASFQALQHRMVDMNTQIELSRSLTIMATLTVSAPDHERRKAVSAAKAFISEATKFVGQGAVQIHGGIGTTDELAISHYFKRATVIETQFGSAATHLKRMGEASSEPAA
ncbi:acyl-CoA dehydrogenase family protein [Sphingosinicellaceae bacterium]|nr:acyl-CoA dehydrogenase family protein [Sphingosinicellaceae bacterium]